MARPIENRGVRVQTAPEPMSAKPAVSVLTAQGGPAPEVVHVRSRRIACDGVGGALGHPRVWLEMGGAGFVECPYCDRRFELTPEAGEGAAPERLAPGVYQGSHGH